MNTIDAIKKAALAGGEVVKKYFGQDLEITQKLTNNDFITKADLEAEAAILEVLQKEFPEYNIFSEEIGKIDKGSEYEFIVDPLDGSNNFTMGSANRFNNIALVKGEKTIAGVINLPLVDRIYSATSEGAFRNDIKISVSDQSIIEKSNIGYMCYYTTDKKKIRHVRESLFDTGVKRVVANWCPGTDLCLMAEGKTEGIINIGSEVYDCVAGRFICEMAGAKVTSLTGEDDVPDRHRFFIISNGQDTIHNTMLEIAKGL